MPLKEMNKTLKKLNLHMNTSALEQIPNKQVKDHQSLNKQEQTFTKYEQNLHLNFWNTTNTSKVLANNTIHVYL